MLSEVTQDTFEELVLIGSTESPILVEIWAPWCLPCEAMRPAVENTAVEYEGRAQVYKLNADDAGDIPRVYGAVGIPALLYFRHGKLVDRSVGVQAEKAISIRLARLFEMDEEDAAKKEIKGLFRWPRLSC